MALQALLFSKNPETVQSLTSILAEAGVRTEVCADIFSAIDKATKEPFPCVIADWVEQPESGFLIKRARESVPNRNTVPIAIVDSEFAAKNASESQVEFAFFRPIAPDEARAVLAKARQKMIIPLGASNVNLRAALAASPASEAPPNPEDPDLLATADHVPESSKHHYEAPIEPEERVVDEEGTVEGAAAEEEFVGVEAASGGRRFGRTVQKVFAIALLVIAGFCSWRGRGAFLYLARTPEGCVNVLKRSLAALFYVGATGAEPVGSAGTEAQQDAYFSRRTSNPTAQPATVQVVNGEISIPDVPRRLRPAFDFPLPAPQFVPAVVPPPAHIYAKVPDSLKNSAPIGTPIVVTVNPASQILPVSTPAPAAYSAISEPADLTEKNARSLLVHTVEAGYPQQGMAEKLHGVVVLQVVIGRDGSVQDVKILRGYMVLGRAAAAAVKQWRFKPYTFNGVPVSFRTQITMNFSYPPA